MLGDIILVHGDAEKAAPGTIQFRTGFRRAGERVTVLTPKEVTVAQLKPKEVEAEKKNPRLIDLGYAFRTKLIRPVKAKAKAGAKAAPATTWGVEAIGADVSAMDGSGVTIAVLDTGIQNSHAAFQGVTLTEMDFSGDGNGDKDGHGTHCAGTIFGRDVNGQRIGVARGVTNALIGKVLGDDGSGDSGMMIRGLQWAQANGAQIVSMSIGFDFPGQVAELIAKGGYPADIAASLALEGFRANLRLFDSVMGVLRNQAAVDGNGGCLIVAASGNESRLDENANWRVNVSLPAAAEGVLAVGAVQQGGSKLSIAPFSNSAPGIVAPGVGVVSAKLNGKLVAFNGTSMACPHVAGAAALWWQKLAKTNQDNAQAVRAQLLAGAKIDMLLAATKAEDRGQGLVRCP